MSPVHVVCCGLATLDLIYEVEAPPGRDTKVVADGVRVDAGGPALNAARTVAALGGRVTLVTALGTGPMAELIRAHLAGIAVVDVAPPSHTPPVSTVMLDRTGGRSIVSTNARALRNPLAVDLPPAASLLVDGHLMTTGIGLATAARQRGIPVILDGGSWKEGTQDLLPLVTVAALSADFRLPDGADALAGSLDRGAAAAVRTNGPAPVEVWTADGDRYQVPVPAVPVVDTLGAGDVFHGALSFALGAGSSLADAVAVAIGLASGSVRHPGALGWASES